MLGSVSLFSSEDSSREIWVLWNNKIGNVVWFRGNLRGVIDSMTTKGSANNHC